MFTLSLKWTDLDLEWEELYSTNTEFSCLENIPSTENFYCPEDLKEEKFVSISRETSPKGYESVVQLCESMGLLHIVKPTNPESSIIVH